MCFYRCGIFVRILPLPESLHREASLCRDGCTTSLRATSVFTMSRREDLSRPGGCLMRSKVPEGPNLGKMLRYVGRPLAVLLAYDIIVAVGYVYGGWRWIASPHIPLAIFGGAIGAILAFRNISSYARWWEARILWGQIANSSRTLAREALSMIAAAQHDEAGRMEVLLLQRRIVFLQIAYVHALRC